MKERGIKVAAVRAWHEVKAHAPQIAIEPAGQVRDWLSRGAGSALDTMGPQPGAWDAFFTEAAERELRDGLSRDLARE